MIAPCPYQLRIGRRHPLPAADFATCSKLYRAACEEHGRDTGQGASSMPAGYVWDVTGSTPRRVAYVSWNGRVWPPGRWTTDTQPLYDPPSAAAPAADAGSIPPES